MMRARSLRSRLTVGVLLLTALGLALAATSGALLLRTYLVSQVDAQLAGSGRFADAGGLGAPNQGPRPRDPAPNAQLPSPFVLTRLDAAGAVITQHKGTQVSDAPAPDLTGLTLDVVRSLHGEPFDVAGVGGSSYSYRASAVPLPDGSGSVVLAISMEPIDQTMHGVAVAGGAIALLTLGLVGLLAGAVVTLGLRPLEQVEVTAERIAAGDLTQRVPAQPAGTEVGRLSASLNGMLSQIEAAFDERTASEDRLRRFVADASHELRTPLTTIRGYAELTRSGALTDDADRLRATARIEAEAARMGVLVDDLLLLARLDQQRPLDQVPVDLVPIVEAAASGLRASAPDRDVTVALPATAVVVGDATRLRQVVDNLAANARVHTAPGTPVALVVEPVPGQGQPSAFRVVVSDSGPGMSAEEVAHATDRFYRGDPSRTRRTGGGTGLGLSIAAAIIAAHGGALELRSTPEQGTTVAVVLPVPGPRASDAELLPLAHDAARSAVVPR
jgi:two-component system OmpR family sensor kinase